MTRETPAPTAPQGGVDTATRMLTRRELEVVRARLAEAEGAEGASAEAESAGAEAGGAAGAGAGSRGAEGEDVVVGGVRGASAETGAESGDSGDAVAGGSEGASAAGSAGDVKADSADAVAGDSEDASADAGADSVDSAEGSQDAEAQGDQGTAAGDDRLRAAVAAWVASTDAKGDKPVPGADEGAEASDEADEADDAAVASGADARGDADAGTASKADSSAEGEAEASGTATDAEPAEASSDGGETSAASSDADEPAEASGDSDKTSAASGDADGADAAPKPPAAEGADTAEDTAEAGEAAKGVGAAETPAADGTPKGDTPADGEAAPPGPPAPDDESGTGGAGGNTKAEGGAEAVDQATAVFRAVRPTPTKPPVDHPTTTLKAPKPAAETPAERTSKFVALKPDIRYDTPKAPEAPKAPAVPKAPTPDVTAAIPQVGPERTAQQPLPPRPPLDLLAELTNTPPPPDTPVRTALRRVKIWTPLVLLLAIIFAIAQAVRPLPTPTLALTAEESYTFDGSKVSLPWPGEGQGWMDVNGIGTMGDFGKQTPVAIGSVAKAMTAYVVLKDHALKTGEDGEKIEVDALAEKEGGYDQDGESTLNTVKQGDTITLRDAIAAIMIPSANNIARLLARWDAGSEKAFIEKMNAAAKELGMTNTTYTDASGLKESTVSTAEDQVKLGNELVRIPALMEITSMGQWIDPSGQKWYNYNYLVPYNGAIGIKTGTTTAAGGNLLFAARKEVGGETVTLVGAILGQHKAPIIQTVNDVSKVAMLAAQDELNSAKILKKGDVVGYVDDGLGGSTPVVLTKDVTAVGWAGFKVKLSFDADDVPHTAKAGTKVGTLTVGDGTDGAVKVPVALQSDLAEPGFTDKLTRIG